MYIKNKSPRDRIGEWVTTKRTHADKKGIFTAWTRVKIIGFDPLWGYSIRDLWFHKMYGIGFEI